MSLLPKVAKRVMCGGVGFFIGFIGTFIYCANNMTFEEALGCAPIAGIITGLPCLVFGDKVLDWIIKGF